MKRLTLVTVSFICLIINAITLDAQEVLTGLSVNKPLAREAAKAVWQPMRTTLQLPFVEDFSNYVGYPNPALWQDNFAYVNRTFAIQPPTMGVATLDALDENGRVYARACSDGFEADVLTSLPIRLDYNFTANRAMQVRDSLYLSFYYQPAGGSLAGVAWERVGNRPEGRDSLILEFGYATGEIVFTGFQYCDYYLDEGESYVIGDTLENPFMEGNDYVFETAAFPGDVISLPCDSLFGEEMVWEHIWSAPGELLDDWLAENDKQYFKQVLIPITDSRWFINNFQFRFRNLASLEDEGIAGWASNVDQWHIDYVKLDINRTCDDIYQNDLAFVAPTTSILRDYQAMPWSQYRDSELNDHFENALVNLSNTVKNSDYTYSVRKVGGSQIATYTTNNENAEPYWTHGLHDYLPHVAPAYSFSSLPTDNADSATFVITHIFQEVGNGSQFRSNDTCVYYQKFNNYYAYDDGTAEAGYSILSTMTHPEVYFAMRFTLNQPDTLRAVRMWFNSVLDDANFADFTLMVWGDNDGVPGEVLYEAAHQFPNHAQQLEDFVNYYLDEGIAVDGAFYVGFYQNHATQLNLGFDQNTDSRAHWLYKTASEWQEPFLKGTPMIRPVVGKYIDHSGIAEVAENQLCEFYPNPVSDVLHVLIPENVEVTGFRIFDAFGRLVEQNSLSGNAFDISMSKLQSGMYLIQLIDNQNVVAIQKIVKQ